MIPIVAIIGRSNVGKSTLFNKITKTNYAIVDEFSGSTIDRKYYKANIKGSKFIIIDTAGIDCVKNCLKPNLCSQSFIAIKEADVILFVVDAKAGLTKIDKDIANYLHNCNKKIYLVINKIDDFNFIKIIGNFFSLGFDKSCFIYSYKNSLIKLIKNSLKSYLKFEYKNYQEKLDLKINNLDSKIYENTKIPHIKLAIVGRPNVGKSTLINCILKKKRVIVSDLPGTTVDSIYIPTEYNFQKYILIDTAGVRKSNKNKKTVEMFSVAKTLEAIKNSDVVLLLIDAYEGILNQDLFLLNFILNRGKSLVIAVNKCDKIDFTNRKYIKNNFKSRFNFIDFIRIHFISALNKEGINNLFKSIEEANKSKTFTLNTSLLTRIMKTAEECRQLPFVYGSRAKMKYAHMGGTNPPVIVIHGNKLSSLPNHYKRYLRNYFNKSLNIFGISVYIKFKDSKNPYIN